uniref:Endogenous retrovirus group 3 member 1 Env polyprotein n=1 Tax=Pogona vitticeps TaxID=103695 RepID=A0ABM5FV82_9SAUR
MDPRRIFGAPRDLLEVQERKSLVHARSRLGRRRMERPLPTTVRSTPLVSWKHIWQILAGRPRVNGKMVTIIGFIFTLTVVASTTCPCTTTTRRGSYIHQTLVYKSTYKCQGAIEGCHFNGTEYKICRINGQDPVCYDPEENPERIWVELRVNGKLITRVERKGNRPLSLIFDACGAISHGDWTKIKCGGIEWVHHYMVQHKYMGDSSKCGSGTYLFVPAWSCVRWATWSTTDRTAILRKVPVKSDCTWGSCNLVNFTILQPEEWDKKDKWGKSMWDKTFSILINGKGKDPGAPVKIVQVKEYRVGEDLRRYMDFWKEVVTDPWEQSLTTATVNLFIELAQTIAATLNVSNCYICGGTILGDQWPWEAIEWNFTTPYNLTGQPEHSGRTRWDLSNNLVGTACIQRTPDRLSAPIPIGDSNCQNVRVINGTSMSTWGNLTGNPWMNLTREVSNLWHNGNMKNEVMAPNGLYWICGKVAYSYLLINWTGTCFLGHLKPFFFMIPLDKGATLGQVGEEMVREKRELKIGNWKDDEWPPERIIAYYDPATWAQDGAYGYRTPIYMLNRLIRLQAVVELLTRENEQALLLLAKQNTKIKNAIYQNRLALDYLLAAEGGVCGKFNLTNCCLEIGDTQEAIAEITGKMRKLAHVPVQKWTGMLDDSGWLGGIFNNWKQALFFFTIFMVGLMILPCVIPLIRNMINSAVEAAIPKTQMVVRAPEIKYRIIPETDQEYEVTNKL